MKKRWALWIGLVSMLMIGLAACQGAGSSPAGAGGESGKIDVEVVDSSFAPAEITVKPGTTVVWTQTGSLPHTVTADDGSFDSGDMKDGDTFSHTFQEPGTYPYYCVYHGDKGGVGMAGVVTVSEEGGSDSSSNGSGTGSGY